MRDILRRLRGAVGNAAVWGTTWFAGALSIFSGMNLIWGFSEVAAPWSLVLLIATNVGVTGFITGLAFSAYLRLGHFDRPLLGIRVGRTSLAGAAVAGLTSMLVGTLMRVSFGIPLVLVDLLAGVPMVALFGAGTAGATLYIAQRSARALSEDASVKLEREQEEAVRLLQGEAV